jgi:hypothetical protein
MAEPRPVPTTLHSCSLCGAEAEWCTRQRLLGRHDVDYFQCRRCELLQTESPYWLDEAYAQAMSQLDTGAVLRNQDSSRIATLLALVLHVSPAAPCLDYGGGHGVFARMMRDVGLDFHWYDKHAENLFARGFEGDFRQHYTLVTAFEVLEHLADVRAELEQLFAPRHDFVFVATLLHAGHQAGWWYYMLESGQHVSFFSRRTMELVGEMFGYEPFIGAQHTLFVRRDIRLGRSRRALASWLVQRPALAALVPAPLVRRVGSYRSRVEPDHQAAKAKSQR